MSNKKRRFRLVEIMQDKDRIDIDKVSAWLNKISCDYLIVLHDLDLPRAPHYHIFVRLTDARTLEDIAKQCGTLPQYVQIIKKGWNNALAYAFHLTPNCEEDGKAKYTKNNAIEYGGVDLDAIFKNDEEYKSQKVRELELKNLLLKYGECEISKKDLLDTFTASDYLKFSKDFKKMQEYRIMKVRDRNMTVIYLTGASGCGKTTLAKYFARIMNYDFFVSGSGKDVLDGYDKEECIILDDLRGDTFTKAELFKLTDNNTNSSVKSRFRNKDISYCKLMIITSIKNPRDLYNWDTIGDDKDETFAQFARRLNNRFYYIYNNDILECLYDLDYIKTTKKLMPFNMAQVFELLGIEKKLGSDLMDEIFKKTSEEIKKRQEDYDKDLPF